MQYTRAYQYVFEGKKWGENLLLSSICMLIPIIGPIVLWGYLSEVMHSLLRDETRPHPDFDFGRFVEYLKRGVWPLLAMLVVMAVGVPLCVLAMATIIIGAAIMEKVALLGGLLFAAGVLLHVALIILLSVLTVPLFLRAILTQDLGATFSWTFFIDFLHRTFWEIVLAWLFLSVTGTAIAIAGMCFCFVGVYPAMALVTFAQFDLYRQLYKLYLERGGTPIPLKERSQKS